MRLINIPNLNLFFDHDYSSYFMPDKSDFEKAEDFRCDILDLDTMELFC